MERNYSIPPKFLRGQVWMVAEAPEISEIKVRLKDRTQCYTRPCVIVSAQEKINRGDCVLNVLPISSRCRIVNDEDILFYNRNKEKNKIVLRQIMTKDVKDFISYMYTLPSDIMETLDSNLLIQLGLNPNNAVINDNVSNINSKNYVNNDYDYHVAYVDKLDEQSDEQPDKQSDNKTDKTENNNIEKRIYSKWTIELAKQFLHDETILSKEEMKIKYNCSSNTQLSKKKSYAKSFIEKHKDINNIPLTKAEKVARRKAKRNKMNSAKSKKIFVINDEMMYT